MAWIESHDNLGEHPKVYALSTALNVRKTTCVGVLHLLWHFTLKFSWRDGDLSKFSAKTIAQSIGYDDDENKLIKALQDTGWLDGMVVHDWFDYAGRIIKDRIYNENRKKEKTTYVKRRKTSVKRPQNDVLARKIGATLPNQTLPNQTNNILNACIVPSAQKRFSFKKPTLEEIDAYCKEKGYALDAERFFSYYESNGWRVGKNPMISWRAAIVTWIKSNYNAINKTKEKENDERYSRFDSVKITTIDNTKNM